ncbi:choline-phosphate cytidylyltransferase [Sporosarcina sp. P16b]|uniref:phosphocholine cytidylyltransferase family protein n=1 Tax=Sporosarcina sp. P16b TaxID=2048261 RepID=UPI000C164515|nr:phosphocholine cytidylyltransferase family protein [Sporosarcina sp. P16b]PIC69324.1 choline-phosphate cytidylyltransferase [Sporosarcina sp. P16b]
MKAILLAGGRGTRISEYIGDVPKCSLDIGGRSLIRHTVELFQRNNIEVIIVVGYKADIIKDLLCDLDVTYYFNPFYSMTNSIASLWFSRNELHDEDMIIANADVYFEQNMLDKLLGSKHEQTLLMDSNSELDYLFFCNDNQLIGHGKDLKEYSGEYVGIAKIKKIFLAKFVERLDELIKEQNHDFWWENVLYSFINEITIHVVDVSGLFWSEIDVIEDYQRILEFRRHTDFGYQVPTLL